MRYLGVGILAGALSMSLGACTQPTDHHVERTDIDGVPLVRTLGAPKYEGPILKLESDLVLGVDAGEPEWQMFSEAPYRLLVSRDGRMVFPVMRDRSVLIVSPDGHLLARFGGKGAGPEEFEGISDLVWAEFGREFWVTDSQLRRISRYTVDGEYLGSFGYADQWNEWARNFWGIGGRRFLGRQDGRYDRDIPMRFAFLDENLDFVSDFLQMTSHMTWTSQRGAAFPIPFSSTGGVDVAPDGRLLSYYPYEGRLTVHSTYGREELHIERDWDYPAVTADDRQRTIERFSSAASPQVRELADQMPFPERRAAFDRAMMDDEGRVWVRRSLPLYDDGEVTGYTYDLFGADGGWIGSFETDVIPLRIAGGYFYWGMEAETGGPRLERLRIVPLVRELELLATVGSATETTRGSGSPNTWMDLTASRGSAAGHP